MPAATETCRPAAAVVVLGTEHGPAQPGPAAAGPGPVPVPAPVPAVGAAESTGVHGVEHTGQGVERVLVARDLVDDRVPLSCGRFAGLVAGHRVERRTQSDGGGEGIVGHTHHLRSAPAPSQPGAGSDLQGVKTTAIKSGNQYVVNESKTFITNGQLANFIIVVAKTDPAEGAKGTSLIVVETDGAEGFERGRNLHKIGMEANDTSELFFNEVQVPGDNIIGGTEGQGFIQLMQQLPQERLNIAVQGVAAAERG